jgi:seryl-tRNA(Sec) selenium transferase
MPAEVLAAMNQAAQHYVSLRALQDAAGRRIAEVVGAPAALVSSGAAGAILLGAAACLTGADKEKVYALPDTPEDGKNQILVWAAPRPNYMYQACRAAGAKLVQVGEIGGPVSPDMFRDAMGPRTAGVLLVLAPIDQARDKIGGWEAFVGGVARYANAAGVPVLVDAASELPPRGLIRQLLDLGAAAAIVSGGKAIRGPQSTGILAGRPDLVEAAALNNNPLSAIGRPMKVGKEEICGLVAAVERFFAMDEAAQLAEWHAQAQRIAETANAAGGQGSRAATGPRRGTGVRAEVIAGHPDYGRPPLVPKAVVRFDGGAAAADALAAQLAEGEPSIQGLRQRDHLILNPMTLGPGEAEIVARRLRAALHELG